MEEKKNKNNILTIVLVVLLLIVVGVICYLLGINDVNENNQNNNGNVSEEKENNQDSENNPMIEEETSITPVGYTPKCSDSQTQQKNLLVDIDETKYINISEYIQKQKNVKINISYCKVINSSTDEVKDAQYQLTDTEKNNVLAEMKNSTFEIKSSGIGGMCQPTLRITYEKNNNQYYIEYTRFYEQLFAMNSDDGNIYKILDKTVENSLSEPQYCLYVFDNLSNYANSLINTLTTN